MIWEDFRIHTELKIPDFQDFLSIETLHLMQMTWNLELAQLVRNINSKPRSVPMNFHAHKFRRARHVSAAAKTSCCFIDTTQVLLPAGSKSKAHWFNITSFSSPTHCSHCTSLMVGLIQQGYGLEVCSFTRYASCKDSAPKVCPTSRQSQRPLEVDMQKGIRTPYKVYNKVQNIPVQRKDGKGSCIGTKFLYYLPKGKSTQPDFVVNQSYTLEIKIF